MRIGLILLLATSAAFSQARGTPASVTSLAPASPNGTSMVIHGVPSSVTSLGPQGFTPHANVIPGRGMVSAPRGHRFGGKRFDGTRFDGNGFGFGGVPVFVPVYGYGYGYDYGYNDASLQQQQVQPQQQELQPQQPQRLEIVVRDKRDVEKEAAENEAAVEEAAKPRTSNLSEPPREPAIFIFKDGTRKELGNFAIMAGMLYDLSDNKVHKFSLNTIDRDATLAANAEAGREINLP